MLITPIGAPSITYRPAPTQAPQADAYAGPVDHTAAASALLSRPTESTDRWTVPDAFPYGDCPAADDTAVYAATLHGRLRALDAATGEERWSRQLAIMGGAPVLSDDGRSLFATSVGGQVSALDPTDGTPRWQTQLNAHFVDRAQYTTSTLVLRSQEGGLFALDAASGEPLWHRPCPPPVHLAPLATPDGLVLVAEGNTVTALDVRTGDPRWHIDLPGKPMSLGTADNVPVIAWRDTQGETGPVARWIPRITATADGTPLWTTATSGSPSFVDLRLAARADDVLASTSEGHLVALHPEDGRTNWRQDLTPLSRALSRPVQGADGRVYVSQYDGTIHRRDAAQGTRDGARSAPGTSIQSPPTVTRDGSLYLVDDAGTLHAVRTRRLAAADLPNAPVQRAPKIEVGEGWVIIDRVRVPKKPG